MHSLNNSSDSIYKLNKKFVFSLTMVSIVSLAVGFTMNFSVKDKLIGLIESGVKSNRKCPMNYRKLDLSTVLPKIKIFDLNISSACLGSSLPMKVSRLETSLSLPSISPLGATFSTRISDQFSKIELDSIHGFSSHYLKLHSSKLNAKTLTPILNGLQLTGDFKLNSNVELTAKNVESMNLSLTSKNFTVPAQSMMGFDLPAMKIGQVGLKAKLENSKELEITQLVLGQDLSPIRAKITGSISIDKYRFKNSKMDMKVVVKFSKSFLDSFSILNLFLDTTKRDQQGFYNLRFKGKVGSPGKPTYEN